MELDLTLTGDDEDDEEEDAVVDDEPDLLPHFAEYIEFLFSLRDKLSSKTGIDSTLSVVVDSLDSIEGFEHSKLI